MEIKTFDEDFDYCKKTKKLYRRTPFVTHIFAEHLLEENLSMAASIELKVI